MSKSSVTKLISASVVALILAGCATTFKQWKLSDVQEGMDREQVMKILGAPDRTETKNGAEYLYYSYQESMGAVGDLSTETTTAELDKRIRATTSYTETYRYEIMIVDGKLVNYKELTEEPAE
jgi:outer membrane protein assembly factor BamE (lipoprotein component of BamABCDE complex)